MRCPHLFLFSLFMLLVHSALAGVTVSYVGQDKCHVSYGHTNLLVLAVELRVQDPGSGWRTLASGTTSIGGMLSDSGLGAGGYSYQIWEESTSHVWSAVATTDATVNGQKISGVPLFDELVENNGYNEGVVVTASREFGIGAVTISNGTIEVFGEIGFDPNAIVSSTVILHSLHSFNDIGPLNLSFVTGSEGSTITDGNGFTAAFNHQDFVISGGTGGAISITADDIVLNSSKLSFSTTAVFSATLIGQNATISGIQGLSLNLFSVVGDINISDTRIAQHGGTLGNTDAVFRLSYVTWQGDPTTFGAPVEQADHCDFQAEIITREATFKSAHSKFYYLTCDRAPAGKVQISDGLFQGSVAVLAGSPEFQGCEFGGHDVTLLNRSGTVIQDSIFLGYLAFMNSTSPASPPAPWYSATTPSPDIQDNAFMGQLALYYNVYNDPVPSPPIAIGANYYGDPSGYRNGYPPAEFLGYEHGHIGAWVTGAGAFNISPWAQSTSLKRTDTRVFPTFWEEGLIAGQNLISHDNGGAGAPIMSGRDTLLSIDLVTSDTDVRGLRVYADYEGQTIEATFAGPLRRDRTTYRKEGILYGMGGTFDMVLPPAASTTATFDIYLDASGVKGFDQTPTGPAWIRGGTLTYNMEPPERPMSFIVFPIQLTGWLVDSPVPDCAGVESALKDLLPCMFPLPANRINVEVAQPLQISTHSDWISAIPLLQYISTGISIALKTFNHFTASSQTVDFAVAVLPSGYMHSLFGWGAFEGASFALRRDVLFVDESKPSAVLHELGHAIGISGEQYNDFPPSGIRLQAVSLFLTEDRSFPLCNGLNRAMHFPGTWYNWYFDSDWFDIMGNVDQTVWPTAGTLNTFKSWIQNNLGGGNRPAAFAPRRAARSGPLSPGCRRILIWGDTVSPDGMIVEEFVPGTVQAFDVTGLALDEILPPTNGISHHLKGYNASSSEVYSAAVYIPLANGGEWEGTYDITATVKRFTITRDSDSREYLNCLSAGVISNRIISPVSPTSIQESVTVAWSATTTVAGAATNLRHLLLFSTNNGTSWLPPGLPVQGTQVVCSTAFITATSTPLTIRLVSSDGLTNVMSTVSGLTVQDRRPFVEITSPLNGQYSLTGTPWQLAAQVRSYTGAITDTGTWRSSISGVLGSGNALSDVILTQGIHTLTYAVTDPAGLTGTGKCSVTVLSQISALDLGLEEDDFQLRSQGVDPLPQIPTMVYPGRTNIAHVSVRNQGVDASARLSLYVRPPGGSEVLVTQQVLQLLPFAVSGVNGSFISSAIGEYQFRGVLDQVSPADPNTANNTRSWQYGSRYPIISPKTNYLLMVYGLCPVCSPNDGPYTVNAKLTIYNRGGLDLIPGTATISGTDAALFSISNNGLTHALAPGISTSLWIYAQLQGFPLLRRATLELPSNDPERPVLRISLLGLLTTNVVEDTDNDGILDVIEDAIGTDRTKRDSDGDGIDDILEDKNLSGTLDEGETCPTNTDTDADGAADGAEDANYNGTWDYGEANPGETDTDGDLIRDGDELIAGTHPFLDYDFFSCVGGRMASNAPSIRWSAKNGRTYQVLYSPSLYSWTNAPSGSQTNQKSLRVATEDGELDYYDPSSPTNRFKWYRVDVHH